jgi:hypothetical protein
MPMLTVRRSKSLLIAAVIAVIAVATLADVAWAAPNPPGNNGTIKLDEVPFDDLPNNEPHVGCTFQVDFYGYDEGDLDAEVIFEAHPPTTRAGDDQLLLTDTVFIGEDDNSGGGSEAGLDASATYTLDFTGIEPHPVQGFHVKLTIHAEGSQGADVKHKVFWVTGCPPAPTTTTVAPTTSVAPTTIVCPTTTTAPSTTAAPTTTVGEPTTTTAEPTTTTAEPTTTTAEPTTTVGETTTTKAEEPTTTTVEETTTTRDDNSTTSSHEPSSMAVAGAAGPSTSHGATTTEPPTTIPTSTSGATTTTACPGGADLPAGLTGDVDAAGSPGLLPLAVSGAALLSIVTTSLLGLRRRRL